MQREGNQECGNCGEGCARQNVNDAVDCGVGASEKEAVFISRHKHQLYCKCDQGGQSFEYMQRKIEFFGFGGINGVFNGEENDDYCRY